MKSSFRIGATVVGVYWLMLVAGIVLYSAIRIDTIGVLVPIWIGAIGGTVLGQAFALKRTRLWVPIVAAIGVVMFFGTNLSDVLESVLLDVPRHYSNSRLWWSFLPAVVCGYWSLGDRSSLAAFWFPAMVWMLSILDHSTASAILDQSGIVLLCGLVAAFVLFLRTRESRRVELWRAIATTPLVATTPAVVLEEDPDHRLVRTGWTFVTIVLTFAATAWVAPRLWQGEAFDAHSQQPQIVDGLPCCPTPEEIQTTRSRVKEYFDIGRGHDAYDHDPHPGVNCRICPGPTTEIAFDSNTPATTAWQRCRTCRSSRTCHTSRRPGTHRPPARPKRPRRKPRRRLMARSPHRLTGRARRSSHRHRRRPRRHHRRRRRRTRTRHRRRHRHRHTHTRRQRHQRRPCHTRMRIRRRSRREDRRSCAGSRCSSARCCCSSRSFSRCDRCAGS